MIQPAARLRVLLVEDSTATALPLQAFIEASGHLVTHVTTGEAALASYRESPPDMVLMDLIMPGIGGIEATRQIKAIRTERWVPLIIMTALDSDADVIVGLEAGADEYLTKPLNFKVLGARMRAMQRIAGMQKALADVLANVTDGIVLINPQGRIFSFNRAAQIMFGYHPSEVIGENVSVLMPAPHRTQHDGYLKRFMMTREPKVIGQSRRLEGMRRNGTVFPLQLGVSNIMTPDGEVFIGLIHDLSEEVAHQEIQRKLNMELDAAREQALLSERTAALGHFAAGIAHELNTPLGYLQSNLNILSTYATDLLRLSEQLVTVNTGLDKGPHVERSADINRLLKAVDFDYLKDDIPKLNKEMQSGLKRMSHIVDSLRDVLRPGEPDLQKIDLRQSVESALTLLHGRFAPGLMIERDYGNRPASVDCTPAELGQVLINLLQNAIQAAGANGTISIRLRDDPTEVRLSIADNGPGIAPEHLPHLFNPFFTTRPLGEGKGLGLYVAAGIVKRHGGQIDVDSTPGKGSRFTVSLPRPNDAEAWR